MEGEARGNLIFSLVMSKQGNISSNTREKRTSFKLGLFNVSFHYDLPFLLRVPHLNNTFSESDRLTPLPATRRAHSRVPARKLCLVHVKHREWSRAFPCRFFPRLRHARLANDRERRISNAKFCSSAI